MHPKKCLNLHADFHEAWHQVQLSEVIPATLCYSRSQSSRPV